MLFVCYVVLRICKNIFISKVLTFMVGIFFSNYIRKVTHDDCGINKNIVGSLPIPSLCRYALPIVHFAVLHDRV